MKNNYLYIFLTLLSGCANIAMPTGGPKDEKPPELVSSTPSNNQKNFTEKTIELTFNEDIKLKNPKEEILIIPTIGKNTRFTEKKKKVIIEPELEWMPNTTYNFNFREGIQDITEGNPAENLRIAFSTGPVIDSLTINGFISDTFSEKIPDKITVAIYNSDTFDIFKHTPIYFTKANNKGIFSLTNLKSDNYFIYAFDDKNKNLKVDSKTEKFGFLTKSIEPATYKDSVNIPITVIDSRPLLITSIRHTDKTSRIRFNKQIDSLRIDSIKQTQSIYSFGTDKSELLFYNTFRKEDSIHIKLIATDSIGNKIDTLFYLKYTEVKTAEEAFKTKEVKENYDVPSKIYSYTLSYNKPIGHINYDSIFTRYDTIAIKPINKKNITIDTLANEITFKAKIDSIPLDAKQKPIRPEFILGKGSLISIEQDSLKKITKTIKVPGPDDLGIVTIKVETTQKNFIIQVMSIDGKVVQSIKNIKDYTFKNLDPKEYQLRILIDENNNDKWDAGNFYLKKEPEKIILFKSEEGLYNFPLRANWEYGPVLIKF